MATHFSVLAWRIPGMGKPGGLPSMGSHRVGHDWSDLAIWVVAGYFYPDWPFLFCILRGFPRIGFIFVYICDAMYCSLPGSSIHGVLQARVLEWVAIFFSRGRSQPRDWTQVSRIAGRRLTIWATREAHIHTYIHTNKGRNECPDNLSIK